MYDICESQGNSKQDRRKAMRNIIHITGNIAALVGIAVSVITGLVRLSGNFYFLGFETQTLFLASIAIMVIACLAKLHLLIPEQG